MRQTFSYETSCGVGAATLQGRRVRRRVNELDGVLLVPTIVLFSVLFVLESINRIQ